MTSFISDLELACDEAFKISNSRRIAGCWIARSDCYSPDNPPFKVHKAGERFLLLETNDPECNCEWLQQFDLVAYVSPGEVSPVGRARYYLNRDGSVDKEYFAAEAN